MLMNEDSALPATTTLKATGNTNFQNEFSETEMQSTNNVTNNETDKGGNINVTEIVMMSTVNTQTLELQGKLLLRYS